MLSLQFFLYVGVVLAYARLSTSEVCPFRSFRFPRDNQVTDYVQYRSYFPRLSQGTACMWLDSAKFDSPRTAPVSYAVWGNSNEWLIQLQTQHTISVHFGNVKDVASVSGMCSAEAHKVHICSAFSWNIRNRAFYFNGEPVYVESDVENRERNGNAGFVRGGGTLILGNDQDNVNANDLDPVQAYKGNITNFMIWPRVLTAEEISNIAHNCQCPSDYAVIMNDDDISLHGAARRNVVGACPTV